MVYTTFRSRFPAEVLNDPDQPVRGDLARRINVAEYGIHAAMERLRLKLSYVQECVEQGAQIAYPEATVREMTVLSRNIAVRETLYELMADTFPSFAAWQLFAADYPVREKSAANV